jgi:hypothetical protein
VSRTSGSALASETGAQKCEIHCLPAAHSSFWLRPPPEVPIGDEELATVPLTPTEFHGDWNYAVHPKPLKFFARWPPPRSALHSASSSLQRKSSGQSTIDVSGNVALMHGPDGLRPGPFAATLRVIVAPGAPDHVAVRPDSTPPHLISALSRWDWASWVFAARDL